MRSARRLIDSLLETEENRVSQIVAQVEQHLGDVISDETPEDVAKEECWTLCIDAANDMFGRGAKAIAAAKEACAELGYPPKGYRPKKKVDVQPTWPPATSSELAKEKSIKSTGVVHPPYRPDVPLLRGK